MNDLLLVTGPPGAGKSTVARLLARRFERSVLVSGDAFFAFLQSGSIDPWRPESHDQNVVVTQAAASATGRFVSGGFSTVYDGVVGPWFLPTFMAAAGLDRVNYVVLMPSVERCVERVAIRQGHGFTDEDAARHMHRQFADADIDRRHLFVDPPDDPEAASERIMSAVADASLLFQPARLIA